MKILIVCGLIASISFGSLFAQAKQQAEKCWSNPTCKQAVINGATGAAKAIAESKKK